MQNLRATPGLFMFSGGPRSIETQEFEGPLHFGVTRAEFLSEYFERRWRLERLGLRARFEWSDVDELLYRIDPKEETLKLFQSGEIAHGEFVDHVFVNGGERRALNKSAFYDRMSRGATLVLNRVEEQSLKIKRLCTHVSRFTGFPSIANAYLSFGGDGTFGKHWDTHDVFVVQLLGKKRWRLFAPTLPLPLSGQTSTQHRAECPREPVLDVTLNTGDALYLPRGWWHEVTPFDAGSFHVSIGIYPPTRIDYLKWVAESELKSVPSARASVTGGDELYRATEMFATAADNAATLAKYRRHLLEREVARAEFNLSLLLESNQAVLPETTLVSLLNCYAQPETLTSTPKDLREALVKYLASRTTIRLQDLYRQFENVERGALSIALLDLARRDVVNLWQEPLASV